MTGLDAIVDLLRCPHCAQPLQHHERSLSCPSGHSFDQAKQGYVNLLTRPPKGNNADSAEMIAARERFLGRGHYQPLSDRIAERAADIPESGAGPGSTAVRQPPAIAEFGAGTGYYLANALDRLPHARGLATDLSPSACRRAARAHDRLGAVVADTWHTLPVADGCLELILVVFAPRNPAEFARLLRPGGRLLVAMAGDDHLAAIREPLGLLTVEPGKQHRLIEQLGTAFTLRATEQVATSMRLDGDDLYDLVRMGPNAHHQDDRLRARVESLQPPVEVGCHVELSLFERS